MFSITVWFRCLSGSLRDSDIAGGRVDLCWDDTDGGMRSSGEPSNCLSGCVTDPTIKSSKMSP